MKQDSSRGRSPRVSDETILTVFRDADEPVLSTSEVASRLPIKRRATHDRLTDLVEKGAVVQKQIGKSTVYWLPGYTDTRAETDLDEVNA